MQPRSSAELGNDFPYTSQTVCYIEVGEDGTVSHGVNIDSWSRAKGGKSRLFAVWPGQWRSDLFVIDDLDRMGGAFGFIHSEAASGLKEHDHTAKWALSKYEANPSGTYVSIEVRLECGCRIEDIDAFARQMKRQKGWDIATSRGWGSQSGPGPRNTVYSMRARRRSLD
ncbi:hypothetical protein APR12_006417 [Nocardia amikacinitolerans]|uniref:hypothetical protein n=1 Tax=Nocardia amikacinitolerans TaxID=756689 RepID=UPI00082D63ED|nr:hypothetical protein [Nocardia amikacinitolerans]MCP2321027.1 hypothetical protein [Nocardia amikacinitolerans]